MRIFPLPEPHLSSLSLRPLRYARLPETIRSNIRCLLGSRILGCQQPCCLFRRSSADLQTGSGSSERLLGSLTVRLLKEDLITKMLQFFIKHLKWMNRSVI